MTQHDTCPANGPSGQRVSRSSLERLLEAETPALEAPASSLYVKPGEVPSFLETPGVEGREWREHLAGLGQAVLQSDTGVAGFRAGAAGLVVLPPFPLTINQLAAYWDPSPLLLLLQAEFTLGVVLLRLGRFSVAVYRGDRLLSSKTDARYVKGRHSAGGTSQLRFQRIREGQIRRMYDKTCEAVQSQFAPYARELDYLFLGGEKITLNGFQRVCPYLRRFQEITLGRRLNIRDPKRDTLAQVPAILRESRIYRFTW